MRYVHRVLATLVVAVVLFHLAPEGPAPAATQALQAAPAPETPAPSPQAKPRDLVLLDAGVLPVEAELADPSLSRLARAVRDEAQSPESIRRDALAVHYYCLWIYPMGESPWGWRRRQAEQPSPSAEGDLGERESQVLRDLAPTG
jgi:hypothetical protein